MNLNISQIRLDGGTQAREMLNPATVEEYQDAIRESGDNGWPFPDVVVFYDGDNYWLADGFHRMRGAIRQGVLAVGAEVRQGSQRDAVLFAVGANAAHGLRRTRGDKRRAVMRLLDDSEWGRWSDREIGRRCLVSHTMVSKMRLIVTGKVASEDAERVYVNKHGETSTMKTAAIGKWPSANISSSVMSARLSIPELEGEVRAWLRYRTGGRDIEKHVEILGLTKLDRSSDFTSLESYIEGKFNRGDLIQARDNVRDRLKQKARRDGFSPPLFSGKCPNDDHSLSYAPQTVDGRSTAKCYCVKCEYTAVYECRVSDPVWRRVSETGVMKAYGDLDAIEAAMAAEVEEWDVGSAQDGLFDYLMGVEGTLIRAMAGQPVEVVARLAALNLEIRAVRSLLESDGVA